MKMKYLIFALLTVASASSFTGCNDSTPDPTPELCDSCENETIVDSLFEYEAIVKKHLHDPESEPIYILSIKKIDITFSDNKYSKTTDSLFRPCPILPKEYQKIGLKVKITGYTKSCTGVIGDEVTRPFYGRKLDLVTIKKH